MNIKQKKLHVESVDPMIRKVCFVFMVVFVLLLSNTTAMAYPASHNAPYWVKPGTFLEYKAQSYHPFGGGFIFVVNNTKVGISGPNVSVVFRIVRVSDGLARVNVSISVYGSSQFPVYVIYPSNATFKPFWSNASIFNVTTIPNNITKVLLGSVTVGGQYMINLTSGWVYDLHGRPYGHTVLWDGFKPNETFAIYNGKPVRITEVRVLNVTVKTYYSTFPKPNILVHGQHVKSAGAITFFDAFYNPAYDLCLSFIMGPIPDFNSIGVYGFLWTDDKAASIDEKLLGEHGGVVDGIWVQGVILANSSLSPGSKTKVTPPSTSELYILPVALFVVVAGVLLLKYGKRR
ncbi:hypothetical protein [Thermococcus sp.]|uniref:hypothetical protein n=1 Tax=Thermococcus sp. TaxID=35749 RepID=UPI0025E31FA1|nr:hypothetical protein [Thermococcus sp.]